MLMLPAVKQESPGTETAMDYILAGASTHYLEDRDEMITHGKAGKCNEILLKETK
jgi:hypothetical protein